MDAALSEDERYLYTAIGTGIQLIQLLNQSLQFDIKFVGFIPLHGTLT